MRQHAFPPFWGIAALVAVVGLAFFFTGRDGGPVTGAGSVASASGGGGKLRMKDVEIRGRKVRLPIPVDYEEMRQEDAPLVYDLVVKLNSKENGRTLLAALIHSKDKALLQQGKDVELRYGAAFSSSLFGGAVMDKHQYIYFRERFVDYVKEINDGANDAREEGESVYEWEYIYKGDRSVSSMTIDRSGVEAGQCMTLITESYAIIDKKIIGIYLCYCAKDEAAVAAYTNEMVEYVRYIDQDH